MVTWTKDFVAERYGRRGKITVGDHTYGTFRLQGRGEALSIGRYCSLADGITIFLGGQHRPDFVTTYPFNALPNWPSAEGIKGHPHSRGPIIIGNDVWIGSGVTIVQGVTIGDGAVIGACSVVARDVAPYSVHVGNPARFVRARFDEATVAALLELRWWDWPDEKVARATRDLMSDDIATFISRARAGDYDL